MSLKLRKQIYNALLLPQICYCVTIWSATSEYNLNRLEILVNRICRHLLMVKARVMHTSDLHSLADILSFRQLTKYHSAITAYKLIKGNLIINVPLPPRNEQVHAYPTRHSHLFQTVRLRNCYEKKAPSSIFSELWNALPDNLKAINSISSFKKKLKRHISD